MIGENFVFSLPSLLMNVKLRPEKYLRYLYLPNLFATRRTKEILSVNPTVDPVREEAREIKVFVYDFGPDDFTEHEADNVIDCFRFKHSNRISWINIDGLRKSDVEAVCTHFDVHPLLIEHALSLLD